MSVSHTRSSKSFPSKIPLENCNDSVSNRALLKFFRLIRSAINSATNKLYLYRSADFFPLNRSPIQTIRKAEQQPIITAFIYWFSLKKMGQINYRGSLVVVSNFYGNSMGSFYRKFLLHSKHSFRLAVQTKLWIINKEFRVNILMDDWHGIRKYLEFFAFQLPWNILDWEQVVHTAE